jgi:hypothetical protein
MGGDKYEDPVTDLPFSTRSLQLEKMDLPTKMPASKSRTKFTEEQNAMMTITGVASLLKIHCWPACRYIFSNANSPGSYLP